MPNDTAVVTYYTVSIDGTAIDAQRDAADAIVRREGGRAQWRSSGTTGRSYALLELPGKAQLDALRGGAVVYDTAIIALAVFPAVPEALPLLTEALSGPGRPVGVLACRRCDGGVIVEWDPQLSSAAVVIGVIDVELARYRSGRTAELLSPLPEAYVSAIAAEGLATPEIAADRVIESLLQRANLDV